MTCCILEKTINTTYITGGLGQPGNPGVPAKPAYCSTEYTTQCGYFLNPKAQRAWIQADNGQYIQVYLINGVIAQWNELYTWQCQDVPTTTCYPATEAIPPTPYAAPTPAQIIIDYNIGWNSWSRGINPLNLNGVLTFTIANGVHGAFVGLAPLGNEGQNIALYGWGLVVDVSGVKVLENGVVVHSLAASYTSLTALSMERTLDGKLIYRADLNEYTSTTPPHVGDTLYPYVYLYSGGDRLLCASYASLDPTVFSSAMLSGKGTLLVGAPSVNGTFQAAITMAGAGSLMVEQPYPFTIAMTGKGTLTAGLKTISVHGSLPTLTGIASDYNYAFVYSTLPAIKGGASAYSYIPPTPTKVIGTLAQLQFYGFIQTVEIDHIDGTLPALEGIAGDYDYSVVNSAFPALVGSAKEGTRLDMDLFSGLVGYAKVTPERTLYMTINSGGQLISVYEHNVVVTQDVISQLLLQDQFVWVGKLNASFMSALFMKSTHMNQGALGVMLNDLARVWVVNLDNGASSQYENYGFNSFANRNGESFGFADDGIYRLAGDDDQGMPINALIHLGKAHLNNPREKRIPAIYVAAASEGKLVLKIQAEKSDPYFYEMRSYSETLDKHRVDPGRGLRSGHWEFVLLNQDGADFELASLEFVPVVLSRSI